MVVDHRNRLKNHLMTFMGAMIDFYEGCTYTEELQKLFLTNDWKTILTNAQEDMDKVDAEEEIEGDAEAPAPPAGMFA